MTVTPRLAMPLLMPGQAQKEMTHNEALSRMDIAVHACALALGLDTPPPAPEPGQCWIIGNAPTSDWSGRAGQVAGWTEAGWRFLQPFPGWIVWLSGDRLFAHWDGVDWVVGTISASSIRIGGEQVIGVRQPAVSNPIGGGTVDAESRSAIVDILDALRAHGLIADAV